MIRIFGHYVAGLFLLQSLIEVLILMSSVYAAVMFRFRGDFDAAISAGPQMENALLLTFTLVGCFTAMGLYHHRVREGVWGILYRLIISFVIGFLLLSSVYYVFPSLLLGRGVLGLSFIISVTGITAARLIFYSVMDHEALKKHILVLGCGERAATIDKLLRRKADRQGFIIVGYVDALNGTPCVDEKSIIQHEQPMLNIAKQYHVNEIIVALDDRRNSFPMQELSDCRLAGIDVIDMSSFFERQIGKVMLDKLHPSWLIYGEGFKFGVFRENIKRLFDVAVSLLFLLSTWPLMLLTAIAIIIESKELGSILYRQVRVGQNGKLFKVLKFRSMKKDSEADGRPRWAEKKDLRITRVGEFIRKFRIDELPQIINVMKGDMSFVGPRPERPEFVERFSEAIPYFKDRHRVKPGITGWAQICYPYGSSDKDAYEKLQYDLYYVKNFGFFLDLMIIFQTAQVVLWGKGAR